MFTQKVKPEFCQNQNTQLLPSREGHNSENTNHKSQGGNKIPLHEKATTE